MHMAVNTGETAAGSFPFYYLPALVRERERIVCVYVSVSAHAPQ